MKLKNIENIDSFFQAVDNCNGNVYLVTNQGDTLNLKSQLCKYIAFAEILNGDSGIKDLELRTDNPDDAYKFIDFMIRGN